MVKSLPAMQETQVQSLDQEDPLEKEMASHSSILAWRIHWTEEPGRLQSMVSQRVRNDWANFSSLFVSSIQCRDSVFFIDYAPLKASIIWLYSLLCNISLVLIYFMHNSLYHLILYSHLAPSHFLLPTGSHYFLLDIYIQY